MPTSTLRVNHVCPVCKTHMRVPLRGYARTGWNARVFRCFKCKKNFVFNVTCTAAPLDQKLPPVGNKTKDTIKHLAKLTLKTADPMDLTFFNGHHFRPIFCSLLDTIIFVLKNVMKRTPGFGSLFSIEQAILEQVLEQLDQAQQTCRAEFEKGRETMGG
jgi:hypothetical protein